MRAFRWRLLAALSPILMAIAACDDGVVTARKGGGAVTIPARGTTTAAVITRNTSDSSFGSSVVRGGVTGVTVNRPTATSNPTAPPVYRTNVNLTIDGKSPGEWHDRRIVENELNLYLIPEFKDATIPALSRLVTHNSLITFSTMRRGTYHVVYSDENLPSNPETDAQGYKRLDMLGFFVSNALYFDGYSSASRSISLDLRWQTMAEPNSSDSRAGDSAHANGEYTTYKDKFRTKPYRGIYLDSLPAHLQECNYRFVVSKTAGGLGDVVWQSKWHKPETDQDFVSVAWNGYRSRSGPNDTPPDDDPINRLPEGHYFYSIEFYPTAGRAPNDDFRKISMQGQNFITTYYGASQWCSFKLQHGIKPNASPSPGSSPSPTPKPSSAPTSQPTATPDSGYTF